MPVQPKNNNTQQGRSRVNATAMISPNYGRTGLLASRLSGLPVTQPRLTSAAPNAPAASRALKWYPSLLTIPQQLLDALRREEEEEDDDVSTSTHRFGADASLVTYLRVATMAECLVQHWRQSMRTALGQSSGPSRAQIAALYAAVMEWSGAWVRAHPESTTASAKPATFFVPSYKLLVMKEDKRVAEYAHLTRRAVWLLGKEPVVNDVPLEHPSCSAQHAALEMRFVLVDDARLLDCLAAHTADATAASSSPSSSAAPSYTRDADQLRALCEDMWKVLCEMQAAADGDVAAVWTAELQVTDLGFTNRIKLNGEPLPPMEATTVIETDVLEFGYSTRKYVLLRNA